MIVLSIRKNQMNKRRRGWFLSMTLVTTAFFILYAISVFFTRESLDDVFLGLLQGDGDHILPFDVQGGENPTLFLDAPDGGNPILSFDAQVGRIATVNDSTDLDQEKLVESKNIIQYNGIDDLMQLIGTYWEKKEIFCVVEEMRQNVSIPDLPVTIMIAFNCQELFNFPRWGTASFIHLFYAIRLEALLDGNITLSIQCNDADDKKYELIHPWLMGNFPPPGRKHVSITSTPLVCHKRHSLAHIYDMIQYDLRRMAVALVGGLYTNQISERIEEDFWSKHSDQNKNTIYTLPTPAKDDIPLFASADILLDDAVVHFRCGDLMNSNHPRYSLMSFYDYTRFISTEATSIGILTQPFDCAGNRKLDSKQVLCDRCRIVVMSLMDYIQEKFPQAKVTIRNSKDETTALTYARMIMANQTVVGISAFSAYAALAAFGTSYVPIPNGHSANFILNYEPSHLLPPNVIRFYDARIIMVADLKKLWESNDATERVLEWFWNDTPITETDR